MRPQASRCMAIAWTFIAATVMSTPAVARCRADLPQAVAASLRDVVPDDLVRLRDIGPVASVMFLTDSAFAVSPNGRKIAFQIRQADPESNGYCLAMVVMDVAAETAPLIIDRGGTLIRVRFQRGSLADYYAGDAKLIVPLWSPDGKSIAFLKQVGAAVQVWVARADGSGSRQVTNAPVHVEAFAWSADGRSIIFQTRPALAEARQAIVKEGLTGYHYDDRWSPVASNHPWPAQPQETRFDVASLQGRARPANAVERARLEQPFGGNAPKADWIARAAHGLAWILPAQEDSKRAEGQIFVQRRGGEPVACTAQACSGRIAAIGWGPGGQSLWFLRREGWANSELALYSWEPGSVAPRSLLRTRDLLLGCTAAGDGLVCALEQSARPRRVVGINLADGTIREIFDPNPEFRSLRLGKVERLEWRNDRQIEVFGDLVLPPGWTPSSAPLPLVVVQYQTRGFLRGGTDDEFPIFAFAAEGLGVLSLERPMYPADQSGARTADERYQINENDWADKRSVLSAFRTGIDLLRQRGVIDPARVGITGLSDGASSGQFALASSDLFAAASLTACCEEPKTVYPLIGINGTAHFRRRHWPAYTDDSSSFWAPYSMARNAARIRTALLLQSADDEYALTLETYASFREHAVPIDLYVFPDEHHNKWQPAHREAVYRRNLAWFGFWLKGEAGQFGVAAEVARWNEMKDKQQATRASP